MTDHINQVKIMQENVSSIIKLICHKDPSFASVYQSYRDALKHWTAQEVFSTTQIKDKRILDWECGNGVFSAIFTEEGAKSVVAIDSWLDISRIKETVGILPGVSFNKISIDELAKNKQHHHSFDLIFANTVTEHLKDLPKLLITCYNLLSPNGELILNHDNYYQPVGSHDHGFLFYGENSQIVFQGSRCWESDSKCEASNKFRRSLMERFHWTWNSWNEAQLTPDNCNDCPYYRRSQPWSHLLYQKDFHQVFAQPCFTTGYHNSGLNKITLFQLRQYLIEAGFDIQVWCPSIVNNQPPQELLTSPFNFSIDDLCTSVIAIRCYKVPLPAPLLHLSASEGSSDFRETNMNIIFPTFEIAPINNGGVGQYILSMIQSLQSSSYQPYTPLVLLYNKPLEDAVKAREYCQKLNLNCEIFHINEISSIRLTSEDIYDTDKTSLALKHGLEKIITQKNVVGIEWCEHAGMGFHTLRDKHCNPESVFKNIVMWVHLHGAREIWDLTDRYPVSLEQGNGYVLSNYAERLSLELADAWKSPSLAVANWYTEYFGIHNRVFISSLPYKKLAEQNSHYQIQAPQFPLKILCPGRIQYIKGSDIVARACVELCKLFPNQFHVTFAGYNVPTANSNFASSLDEIKSFIPKEFLHHFSFPGKYSSEEYLKIAQESHLAIFPSRVETFCLAAHELNWIGLPLIIPDIPAFKDHFQDSVNCYKFDGTVEDLTNILTGILNNPELLTQIKSDPVPEFNPDVFDQLVNMPIVSKVSSNYILFTKIQELQLSPNTDLHSVHFKDLSVHNIKTLLMAAAWKVMKKLADKLSATPEIRIKIKTLFKLITRTKTI
jgi:glycosyltransferase involved in cell wall biosynthesis/SAM-dependent methyltransferase